MRCEQAHEHLSAYLDRELSSALASAVRAHVASCPECRRTLRELRATAALLGRLPVHAAPAGLADDVRREIEHRMLAPESAADTPTPERTLAVHRARAWPRVLAVAACAALAAGIGLVAYVGTMLPDRTATTAPSGPDALALGTDVHFGESLKSADNADRTLAGDRYDYAKNGKADGDLADHEALNKAGPAPEANGLAGAFKGKDPDADGLTLGAADALALAAADALALADADALLPSEPVPFVGKSAARPEGAVTMKKAPAGEKPPVEKPAAAPDVSGMAQGPALPAGQTDIGAQGKVATQIAKAPAFGRSTDDLERAGQTGGAGQAAQIVQEDQEGSIGGTTLARGRMMEEGAFAAKDAGTRVAEGRAGGAGGGAAPTNAPEVVQAIMNSVALRQAPVEALRRTATPETLQQSPNQLVVQAASRQAANSELVHLFAQNGWAEVADADAVARDEDRKNADRTDLRADQVGAEPPTEPQAAVVAAAPQVPAGPPVAADVQAPIEQQAQAGGRPPEAKADQPADTPGVYYRAHSDGEDTWVVVASADDLPRFAAQVAQSRTMIVAADSTPPFQAVRGLQQELALFEAASNRRSWGRAAPEPTRPPQAPAMTAAKGAADGPPAFAAAVEAAPTEEPPADAARPDRAREEPAAPPLSTPHGGPDAAVQGQVRQRPDMGRPPVPEGIAEAGTGVADHRARPEVDEKTRRGTRDDIARQAQAGGGASAEAGGRTGAKPGAAGARTGDAVPDAAREGVGVLANIQVAQRLPENQVMLIVRVQGLAAEPPAACIRPAERTEAETTPAETKPAPAEPAPPAQTPPDAAPESPPGGRSRP